MTPLQLELTRLIGKKECDFGCIVNWNGDIFRIGEKEDIGYYMAFTKEQDIIGHTAILSDFHRWMNENREIDWWQNKETIAVQYVSPCEYDGQLEVDSEYEIPYDSSEDLFDQSEETLKRIIEIITSNQ